MKFQVNVIDITTVQCFYLTSLKRLTNRECKPDSQARKVGIFRIQQAQEIAGRLEHRSC